MATVGQPGPGAMRRITVHYANSPARNTGDANLDGLDDDLLQFALHQSLLDQACSNQDHMRGAEQTVPSDHPQAQYGYGHGESSTAARASGMDEQLAKQLQEMEDLSIEEEDISCVSSPSDSDDDHDHNEDEADRQDDNDDPDNMTYEQGQALVESVGTESRGLSDELISYLQPREYRTSGLFSRKTKHEDCPICLSTFKHRDRLITLPCKHNYHAICVTKWLKMNKICPVCKYEVFGPS